MRNPEDFLKKKKKLSGEFRVPVPGVKCQVSVPVPGAIVPGARCQVPGARFQVPGTRCQVPGSRCKCPVPVPQ